MSKGFDNVTNPWPDNYPGQRELLTDLDVIWKEIRNTRKDISFPFWNKVKKTDAPDYFSVIQNPMDLSLIGKKLQNLEYLNKETFKQDICLMCENCRVYNINPEHEFVSMANEVERCAIDLLDNPEKVQEIINSQLLTRDLKKLRHYEAPTPVIENKIKYDETDYIPPPAEVKRAYIKKKPAVYVEPDHGECRIYKRKKKSYLEMKQAEQQKKEIQKLKEEEIKQEEIRQEITDIQQENIVNNEEVNKESESENLTPMELTTILPEESENQKNDTIEPDINPDLNLIQTKKQYNDENLIFQDISATFEDFCTKRQGFYPLIPFHYRRLQFFPEEARSKRAKTAAEFVAASNCSHNEDADYKFGLCYDCYEEAKEDRPDAIFWLRYAQENLLKT